MIFPEKLLAIAERAERELAPQFAFVTAVSRQNTEKVMDAFARHRVDAACFAGSRFL